MDKLTNALKKLKIKTAVVAVALIVIGVLFIIFPTGSVNIICYVAGALMLVWGLISLFTYFSAGKRGSVDLALGIVVVCIALLLFIKPGLIAEFLTVILGVALIADGAIKMQQFADLRRYRAKGGWTLLIISVLSLCLGVILAFNPFSSHNALMIYAGVALIVDGVLDICAVFLTRGVKKPYDDGKIIELEEGDIHRD